MSVSLRLLRIFYQLSWGIKCTRYSEQYCDQRFQLVKVMSFWLDARGSNPPADGQILIWQLSADYFTLPGNNVIFRLINNRIKILKYKSGCCTNAKNFKTTIHITCGVVCSVVPRTMQTNRKLCIRDIRNSNLLSHLTSLNLVDQLSRPKHVALLTAMWVITDIRGDKTSRRVPVHKMSIKIYVHFSQALIKLNCRARVYLKLLCFTVCPGSWSSIFERGNELQKASVGGSCFAYLHCFFALWSWRQTMIWGMGPDY